MQYEFQFFKTESISSIWNEPLEKIFFFLSFHCLSLVKSGNPVISDKRKSPLKLIKFRARLQAPKSAWMPKELQKRFSKQS